MGFNSLYYKLYIAISLIVKADSLVRCSNLNLAFTSAWGLRLLSSSIWYCCANILGRWLSDFQASLRFVTGIMKTNSNVAYRPFGHRAWACVRSHLLHLSPLLSENVNKSPLLPPRRNVFSCTYVSFSCKKWPITIRCSSHLSSCHYGPLHIFGISSKPSTVIAFIIASHSYC